LNGAAETENASHPLIRHIKIENELSLTPQNELSKPTTWKICTPDNAGDFTAVGYYFARELMQKLNVPVGIINCSWGGTQIESWISKEMLATSPQFASYIRQYPASWQQMQQQMAEALKKQFNADNDEAIIRQEEETFVKADYDFTKWQKGYAPGSWIWQGFGPLRGTGFMARKIEVPASFANKETFLHLGINDSHNIIYINGKKIYEDIATGKRKITVPSGTWQQGTNTILISMQHLKNPAWYGIGIHGSSADLFITDGKQMISIAGNEWYLRPSFAAPFHFEVWPNSAASIIYNAMVKPLIPYGIKGFLWYQGETNTERAAEYAHTFPMLIYDWRNQWKLSLPFYFVQLSSFGKNLSSNQGSTWAEIRESQAATLSVANTAMVVTTDIGDAADIHPANKQDVGKRLSLIALANNYGFNNLHWQNPAFESVQFAGSNAVVTIKYCPNGLIAQDKFNYVRGFEIAGADKQFYYAQAVIENNKITVSHPSVTVPVAVRYAWADAPVDANVFSKEGLPLAPFRTDTWPLLTQNKRFVQ
jgi:sialate O-acetylesterase